MSEELWSPWIEHAPGDPNPIPWAEAHQWGYRDRDGTENRCTSLSASDVYFMAFSSSREAETIAYRVLLSAAPAGWAPPRQATIKRYCEVAKRYLECDAEGWIALPIPGGCPWQDGTRLEYRYGDGTIQSGDIRLEARCWTRTTASTNKDDVTHVRLAREAAQPAGPLTVWDNAQKKWVAPPAEKAAEQDREPTPQESMLARDLMRDDSPREKAYRERIVWTPEDSARMHAKCAKQRHDRSVAEQALTVRAPSGRLGLGVGR